MAAVAIAGPVHSPEPGALGHPQMPNCRHPSPGPSTAFPAAYQGAGLEEEELRLELVPLGELVHQPCLLAAAASPKTLFATVS